MTAEIFSTVTKLL